MRFAHGLKQKLLPGWIQFGEHIIKKQQWRLPTELGHQFQFSELQAQHQRPLLAG